MQSDVSRLYAVRECSDVFVDAALRDDSGELLFLSIFGRDTAILHFFASFSLPVTNGGRDAFTLIHESETHRVTVSDPAVLEKLTGRLPRGNLFGNLTHAWLYKEAAIKPDRSNRSVLVLRFGETEEVFKTRVWLLIRELCPVPLLDHWHEPLMAAMGDELITPLSAGNAPPIGVVDGARLALPADFEQIVSAAVAMRALTLDPGALPGNSCERIRCAVRQVRDQVAVGLEPPLFELGRVLCTPGIQALITRDLIRPGSLLARHVRGDWGVSSDPGLNDDAVKHGDRIFSVYPIDPDQPCKGHGENTIWIITEADRSATTLLLPEEY
jgi:hypothetical protein